MRRRFILLPTLLLIFQSAIAQNELTRQGLKGKVKMLTNCQCPVRKDGTADTSGCITYQFKFSEAGDQTEDNDYSGGNLYNGFGRLNHKRIYTYLTAISGSDRHLDMMPEDKKLNVPSITAMEKCWSISVIHTTKKAIW
jgi:hypothetical protein